MPTIRWSLIVSQATDDALRQLLAAQGRARKGELSRFIEDAVLARINEARSAMREAVLGRTNESLSDQSAVSVGASASGKAGQARKEARRR